MDKAGKDRVGDDVRPHAGWRAMLAATLAIGAGIVSVATPIGVSPVAAAPPIAQFTADINGAGRGSGVDNIVEVNGALYFTADDATTGVELWTFDGATASRVADLNPFGSSSPTQLTAIGDVLYFSADDGDVGREPWAYDTVTDTMTRLGDINATGDSTPREFVSAGGLTFFVAANGTDELLFQTDGTAVGTVPAEDPVFGQIAGSPSELTTVSYAGQGEVLWMSADADGSGLPELVGYDPSHVLAVQLLALDESPSDLTVLGEALYLSTTTLRRVTFDVGLVEFPIEDLGGDVFDLAVFGGALYFVDAADAGVGQELYTLAAGDAFELVDDIADGPTGSAPSSLTVSGSSLFFVADDGTGEEVWRTNGATTQRVANINPTGSSFPTGLRGAAGNLYFAASADDGATFEAWVVTAAGSAFELADLDVDMIGSDVGGHTVFGTAVLFFGDDGPHGRELLRTPLVPVNGSPANVSLVVDIVVGTDSSNPSDAGPVGDRVIFAATDEVLGEEPYIYDPVSETTTILLDINPAGSSVPTSPTRLGDITLFQADDGTHGAELWRTDGTEAGTTMVVDLNDGADGSTPDFFTVIGTTAYFVADDGASGMELWRTDGTAAGTSIVEDIRPALLIGSDPYDLTVLNGVIYFIANSAAGSEVWRSDGTPAGTHPLVEDDGPVAVNRLAATETRLFFDVDSAGQELWSSDGTALGTAVLEDANGDLMPYAPTTLTPVGDDLYFFANDSLSFEVGLWRYDDLTGNVVELFSGGAWQPDPTRIAPLADGGVIFGATPDLLTLPYETWVSDGTPAGTQLLPDGYNLPIGYAQLNGWTYFTAATPTTGRELWRTDGVAVEAVTDFTGPADGVQAEDLWPVGDRLFFQAIDEDHGTEMWFVDDTPAVPAAPAAPTGTPGLGSVTVSWTPVADVPFAPVTGYVVTAIGGAGTCDTDEFATSCTVTGLTAGTPYTFTVRAINRVGNSPASVPSAPVAPFARPNTPAAPTATAGLQSASVSWVAVPNPVGAPVTGYTVTANSGGATCTTTGATTCTVTNLVAGTPYTFQVRATNAAGNSELSPSSNAVTPTASAGPSANPPVAPGAPAAVAKVRAALVSWSAVADPAGAPVTGYTVTAAPGGATCTTSSTSCTVTGLAAGTAYTFTVVATNSVGNSPASPASGAVVPVPPAAVPLAPARILDTRIGPDFKTADRLHEGVGRQEAGSIYELQVTGRADVPAGADAVMLNVTAVQPDSDGFLTVFPCGTTPPLASSVNYRAGEVVPNAVLAKIGDGGKVCIFTLAAGHVLVDVNGFVPSGGSPSTVNPARILETRSGDGLDTVDGQAEGVGRQAAGSTYELQVTGRAGVPAGADAVMLNVTAVLPSEGGFLTVFPCGSDRPLASSVNYGAGEVVPNAVLAKIGAGGKVCIYTLTDVDLLVDVSGFVPAGGSPSTVNPARILETRSGDGLDTVDGQAEGVGRQGAGSTYELQVAGRGGVPTNATAVMLNVTAVLPSEGGFLTVFPCGSDRPLASSVNYGAGEVVPNAVLAKIGTDGKVCIYTLAATDLLVDVNASIIPL